MKRSLTHCTKATVAWLGGPLLALALAAGAAAQSQYVIIASEPASLKFAPGQVLKPVSEITIPEGTVVTLLGEDGSVHKIPGPATISITEDDMSTTAAKPDSGDANRTTLSKLADLLAGEAKKNGSLGVARALITVQPSTNPVDPWVLSISRSGPGCIAENTVTLGRVSGDEELSFSAKVDGGEERAFKWAKGETRIVLSDLVAAESAELHLRLPGSDVLISLHRLPGDLESSNPLPVMGWMMEQGCNDQALMYARDLSGKAK